MELLQFIPAAFSFISGLFGGNQAQQNNNQVRADQAVINQQQGQYFDRADGLNTTTNNLLFGGDNSNTNFSPSGGMSLGDILRQYNAGMGGQTNYLEGMKGQYQGLDRGYQGLDAGYQGLGQGLSGISGQYGDLGKLLAGLGGQYAGLGGQLQGLDGQYASQGNAIGNLMAQLGGQGIYRADTTGQQNALMQNGQGLMASLNPDAYRNQARLAGQDAITQMSADLAGRGIGGGGVSAQMGAQNLARLYADADSKLNADRLQGANIANNAYGQAGQLNISTAGTNNAAQQNFGQLMASLIGQQSNMTGARAGLIGQQASINGQQASYLGQQAGLNGQQASYLGQQGGLLGQRGNLLSQQQGLVQLLTSIFGQQAGVQQGIVGQQIAGTQFQQNQALNEAQIKGGQAASLNQNINPNPYGGAAAGLGAFGTAAGNYQNQQQQAPGQQAMTNYYNRLNQPPSTAQPYYPPGNTAGPYGPSR